MNKVLVSLCLILLCQLGFAQGKVKSVLYVGTNPNAKIKIDKERNESEARYQHRIKRWDDFGTFLRDNYKNVKMVDRMEYVASMSDKYDVTIIDATIKPIKESIVEKDADGEIKRYEPAVYLPKDYSAATVMISATCGTIGGSIGLKLNWA